MKARMFCMTRSASAFSSLNTRDIVVPSCTLAIYEICIISTIKALNSLVCSEMAGIEGIIMELLNHVLAFVLTSILHGIVVDCC